MAHDHPTLIKEAPSELLEHERRHRHSITGSRIRMLGLLKRGEAKSVREASELIGYSWRQVASSEGADLALAPEKARAGMDLSRLRKDTGWHPRFDLRTGVAAYFNWLQEES